MSFKAKLQQQPLLSTFVKTPHPHVIESLESSALDFLIIDTEHTPHSRKTLDLCLLAARATQQAVLVRVASHDASELLNALDCGANGVLVPHVQSKEQAEHIVNYSYYGKNGRGFAGATRQGGYGATPMHKLLEKNRDETCVVAQVEDEQGVNAAADIAKVEKLDALFIGPTDLSVSLGALTIDSPIVEEAMTHIIQEGTKANKPVGMFVPSPQYIERWRKVGCQFFAVSTELSMMRQSFDSVREAFNAS